MASFRMTGRMASMFNASRWTSSIGFSMQPIDFTRTLKRDVVRGTEMARNWFDKNVVIKILDDVTYQVFNRFGFRVMTDSRRSIRNRPIRKRGPRKGSNVSLPGQSPTNQTGILKQHIYYEYDRRQRSVVIYAARLAGAKKTGVPVPEILEFGGVSTDRRGRSVRIQPRPYLRPQFERQKKRMSEQLRTAMTR